MNIKTHRFQIGAFEALVIQDGSKPGSLEAVIKRYPDVPREALENAAQTLGLDWEAIELSRNILLLDTGTQRVLVDTGEGIGDCQLTDALPAAGISPETIGIVILTHGHGDHIGGLTDAEGRLLYPNARYVMWKTEWDATLETAAAASDPDYAAFIRRNLLPIQDRLTLIESDTDIQPGIRAFAAPGHTVGHMALLIESGGQRLLHIVDAAHHPAQITYTDWSPRFDRQPELARVTRRALIERALSENLPVMAYHFPFPGLGCVVKRGQMAVWEAGTP